MVDGKYSAACRGERTDRDAPLEQARIRRKRAHTRDRIAGDALRGTTDTPSHTHL